MLVETFGGDRAIGGPPALPVGGAAQGGGVAWGGVSSQSLLCL